MDSSLCRACKKAFWEDEGQRTKSRIYGDCLTAQKYGKKMYPCQISVSTHGAEEAATLATPDGRLAVTTYAMLQYPHMLEQIRMVYMHYLNLQHAGITQSHRIHR